MRGWTVPVIAAASAALLMFTAGAARAAGGDDEEVIKPFQFGAGAMGVFGGNFLNKPDDMTVKFQGTSVPTSTYPGFGGSSLGGGLMLEGRFIGLLGLEVDLIRSSDHGHGDITITSSTGASQKFTITVGQSAWHVPVLAKLVAPLPMLRPMVFFGPEFVMPGKAESEVKPANLLLTEIAATSGSYTVLTGGIGIELKLPIPDIDLRIPFTLRGGYNPSVKNTLEQRANYTLAGNGAITRIEYKSEWRYQTYATLGVAAYF